MTLRFFAEELPLTWRAPLLNSVTKTSVSGVKRGGVVAAFWLLLVTVLYVAFEASTRFAFPKLFSSAAALRLTRAEIEESRLTIDEFLADRAPGRNVQTLDSELGWDGPVRSHRVCASDPCADPVRILVLGDSVTVGVGVSKGLEDYVSLLANREYRCNLEIRNAAVEGFGIHQMVLKGARELQYFRPDLILFSYIDSDLIRDALSFQWVATRPTLAVTRAGVEPRASEDFGRFLKGYWRADDFHYYGIWMLRFSWRNRRYLAPWLYRDYYRAVFSEVANRLDEQAAEATDGLRVVRLPQSKDFAGRKQLVASFRSAIADLGSERIEAADIEDCVREELANSGHDFGSVMVFHPSAQGHRAYASCLHREVLLPWLEGRGTEPVQSVEAPATVSVSVRVRPEATAHASGASSRSGDTA